MEKDDFLMALLYPRGSIDLKESATSWTFKTSQLTHPLPVLVAIASDSCQISPTDILLVKPDLSLRHDECNHKLRCTASSAHSNLYFFEIEVSEPAVAPFVLVVPPLVACFLTSGAFWKLLIAFHGASPLGSQTHRLIAAE